MRGIKRRIAALALGASAMFSSMSCDAVDYFHDSSVRGCEQVQGYFCENLIAPDGTSFRTEYRDGDKNKRVIVGAPGLLSTGKTVLDMVPGRRCLAITFPGNPGSDPGINHSIEYDAKLFEQMIKHYSGGILKEGDYVCFGFSHGGFVVEQHAVDRAREMGAKGLEDKVGRIIVASQDRQPDTFGFHALDWFLNFLTATPCFDTWEQTDSLNRVRWFDLRDELREETSCNFLFVGGEQDPLINEVEESANNLGDRARCYMLPDAGHDIPIDELNKIIDGEMNFLSGRGVSTN